MFEVKSKTREEPSPEVSMRSGRRAVVRSLLVGALVFWHQLEGTAAAAPPDVVWTQVEPGVERGSVPAGAAPLELYRFDLARYRVEVVATKGRTPNARSAADVLRDVPDAVAVVNGGFFDENGRSLGLRIAAGEVILPLRRRVDWGVFYVTAARARIVHSREFVVTNEIKAAVQVGPRILIDGVVPPLKPQAARRTAIALDREGATVTLVVAPEAVEAGALGARLRALGFHSALMLDGGPSTQLAVRVGAPPREHQLRGAYAVPDLVVVLRRR